MKNLILLTTVVLGLSSLAAAKQYPQQATHVNGISKPVEVSTNFLMDPPLPDPNLPTPPASAI